MAIPIAPVPWEIGPDGKLRMALPAPADYAAPIPQDQWPMGGVFGPSFDPAANMDQDLLQQMATEGPEDKGKLNIPQFVEQALGRTGQGINDFGKSIVDSVRAPFDWLGGRVGDAPAEGAIPPSAPPQYGPFGFQGQIPGGAGVANSSGELSIPLSMPGAPPMSGGGYAGGSAMPEFDRALFEGLGPRSLPEPEYPEYSQKQMPAKPNTAPLEGMIANLEAQKPQARERGWFEEYGPALIAGLGGLATGGIGGALALGGIFAHRQQQKAVQEDLRFKDTSLRHMQVQYQAQAQLAELDHAYQQALIDTQDINSDKRVVAQNQAIDIRERRNQAIAEFDLQLEQLKLEQETAAAEAAQRWRIHQDDQGLARYKIDMDLAQPRSLGGGAMSYVQRQPDGSMQMKVHQMNSGAGLRGRKGAEALGPLEMSRNRAFLDEGLKEAYMTGNPYQALEVVAEDVIDRAPEFMENFDQVVEQINGTLERKGINTFDKRYAEMYRDELKRYIIESMQGDDGSGIDIEQVEELQKHSSYAQMILQSMRQ